MKARILLGALGVLVLAMALVVSRRSDSRGAAAPQGASRESEARFDETGLALEPAGLAPPLSAPLESAEAPGERGEVAAANETTLEVEVVGLGTGEPLPGLRVFLTPGDPRASWGSRYVGARTARLGEAPLTDAMGFVRFALPPEVPLKVNVLAAPVGTTNLELPVAPLADGEKRVVIAEVALKKSLVFFGRVLDGSDQLPVPGARVRVLGRRYDSHAEVWVEVEDLDSEDFHEVRADAAGAFRLPRASDLVGLALEVEFPGYMPRNAELEDKHTTPERPQTFELLRPASLRLRFLHPDESPITNLVVTLIGGDGLPRGFKMSGLGGVLGTCFEEAAEVGPRGDCEFPRVPAGILLHVRVQQASVVPEYRERAEEIFEAAAWMRPIVHRNFPSFSLDPGEERESVIIIEPGIDLAGRIIDVEGQPVPGTWLLVRDDWRPYFQGGGYTTDEEGRFLIPDIGPGTYFIEAEKTEHRITIAPGEAAREITLRIPAND